MHFDYVLVCNLVTVTEEMGSRAFPKWHSLWNVNTSQCFNCEIILFEYLFCSQVVNEVEEFPVKLGCDNLIA